MRPLFSIEAEQSVLGAILIKPDVLDDVVMKIGVSDFSQPVHRQLFLLMIDLQSRGKPVDAITLGEETGELAYIVDLQTNTPSASNVMAYVDIVLDRARERALFDVAQQIRGLEEDDTASTDDVYDKAQSLFNGLSNEKRPETQVTVSESTKRVVENLDERLNGVLDSRHVMTGLADIDTRISGYRPGDLVIIAARPGHGKTTLGMQIVKHCAMRHGPAMVFSLEMPSDQLTERLLSSIGTIKMDHMKDPKSCRDESMWPSLAGAVQILKDLPIIIDDQASLTINEIRARARRQHRKTPLKMIMIDYLQLMRGSKNSESRNLEVTEISQGLKALAKELEIPVIALAQLNRSLEQRTNKRPMPSDLRDSGSIEQDADIIQFIYRDEVYNPDTEFKGTAEIITSKFRSGKVGTDFVNFEGEYSRFTDMSSGMAQDQYNRYGD